MPLSQLEVYEWAMNMKQKRTMGFYTCKITILRIRISRKKFSRLQKLLKYV